MKKKSASKSAFFNPRLLIGLFMALTGVFIGLVGWGVFSASAARTAQAQPRKNIIIDRSLQILPPGFDCSKIHALGIDRQDNMRAGAIMIACGEAEGGSPRGSSGDTAISSAASGSRIVSKFVSAPFSPFFIGGGDINVILPEPFGYPSVTESESMEWGGPNNTWVVNYNASPGTTGCYDGVSYSTDNGVTWHRISPSPFCTGHGQNFGDPIVVYNQHLGMWFAGDLATGCGGQGIGLWTSPDGVTWTVGACAANISSGNGDRESMWVDNNPASPHYGRMYISYNNFAIGGGALFCTHSDDGVTWSSVQLSTSFIRDIQVTGDLQGGGNVYVASMNEGGGGLTTRQNVMYRSLDGGVTWSSSNAGPAFQGPGRSTSGYFALAFSSIWRHMGWGEPAAAGSVVSLDYAACGQNVACNTASDHGDIYYVRSTDSGVTWGPAVKLNTDTGTAMQWQPSMTATVGGQLFASWYDEREVNGGADLNCTPGNQNQPCYRRWGRVSNDNGATWQPDDMVGRQITPLPAQPDGNIQGTYEGDYDYHSSLGQTTIGGWTDGRVIINSNSQQDVFVNFVTIGFSVSSSNPACGSLVTGTAPTQFVINLTDPANPSSVQATDFTVNGTPANTAVLSNGNQTITFGYTTSPVVLGVNTMHIAAGAILRQSDGQGILDFTCTFCYAQTPLQVTSTNPPVGGTFSPPAPGDYQYDVNFNQAVDPSSVQTSDLTITGNVGGSVTSVTLVNGNTTARFTVHFNFGGSVTLSIAAGAITANGCNGNAAFSGMYTVQGCPPQSHYTISQIQGATIVPGTTDIGNHCDDCATTIPLPFAYTLYDQTYNSINLSSNGTASFTTTNAPFSNICLPDTSDFPGGYTIFPYWDDLYTVNSGYGIFTSVSGSAPNRIFNIEFRDQYFPGTGTAHFELRLYEQQSRFDIIYDVLTNGNSSATAGVQQNGSAFDQYFCNGSGNAATGGQSYILQACAPQLTDAVSRKTHDGAGMFDIEMPLTGPSGVECRNGGATHDYTLVATFSGNVNVTGMPQAQVVAGMGCVGTGGVCDPNGTVSINGAVVTVPLTNIADVQVINVQINGVTMGSDSPAANVNIPMGFLIGDVTGNRVVNASDVALTKSQVGHAVTMSNFREDVNASGTITATDVAIVKANVGHSLANGCALHVLIAYADIGGAPTTIHDAIAAEPGVVSVDYFDAFSGTPTLAQLQQYQLVFAFSNNAWNDATAMGNVLADYEDGGGIVVVSTFAWDNRGGWLLGGRWITGGYGAYNSTGVTNFVSNTANITMPGHPLMAGVSNLTAFYRNGVTLAGGATSTAVWTDGPPAVAFNAANGHTAVSVNAYLGQNPMNFSGDWGKLIVNAARWQLNCTDAPNTSKK